MGHEMFMPRGEHLTMLNGFTRSIHNTKRARAKHTRTCVPSGPGSVGGEVPRITGGRDPRILAGEARVARGDTKR